MRTQTSYTSTEIAKTVTQPFYLMNIGFDPPLLLSSRDTVVIGGDTYQKNGFKVASVKKGKGSKITGSIIVSNHDLIIGGMVLNQGVKNRAFSLYKAYGSGPWVAADLTLMIEGVLDAVPSIGKSVKITFAAGDIHTNYSPRLICAPPVFNHCIPPDTTIDWNNETKTLHSPMEISVPEG